MRKTHILLLTATHFLAASAGGAIGIHILGKKLEQRYDELMAEEVAETKRFYKELAKKEFETPEEALKALHGEKSILDPYLEKDAEVALKKYQGEVHEAVVDLSKSDKEPEKPFDISNSAAHVLATHDDRGSAYETARRLLKQEDWQRTDEEKMEEWNAKQERDRNIFTADSPPSVEVQFNQDGDPTLPHIISDADWNDNNGEREQIILMFYTGDATLVDEHEQIMDPGEIELAIGSMSLIRFGERSNDRNTVYIRNPKTDTDYYVLRSDGSYGEEVAGFGSADG